MDWLKDAVTTFEENTRLKNEKLAEEKKAEGDELLAKRKKITACHVNIIAPVFHEIKREFALMKYFCTFDVDTIMDDHTGEQYVVDCNFEISHTKNLVDSIFRDSNSKLSFHGSINNLTIHIEGIVDHPSADSIPISLTKNISEITRDYVDDIAKQFVEQVFTVRDIKESII